MTEVIDLSTKRKPVHYTVRLTHHWDDTLEVFVEDVADDDRSRASVADALRRAADMISEPKPTFSDLEFNNPFRNAQPFTQESMDSLARAVREGFNVPMQPHSAVPQPPPFPEFRVLVHGQLCAIFIGSRSKQDACGFLQQLPADALKHAEICDARGSMVWSPTWAAEGWK